MVVDGVKLVLYRFELVTRRLKVPYWVFGCWGWLVGFIMRLYSLNSFGDAGFPFFLQPGEDLIDDLVRRVIGRWCGDVEVVALVFAMPFGLLWLLLWLPAWLYALVGLLQMVLVVAPPGFPVGPPIAVLVVVMVRLPVTVILVIVDRPSIIARSCI